MTDKEIENSLNTALSTLPKEEREAVEEWINLVQNAANHAIEDLTETNREMISTFKNLLNVMESLAPVLPYKDKSRIKEEVKEYRAYLTTLTEGKFKLN